MMPWSPAPWSPLWLVVAVTPCEICGDCCVMIGISFSVVSQNGSSVSVYPMSLIAWRTMASKSSVAFVVISPARTTVSLLQRLSQATRLFGSCSKQASRTESEM